MEHMKEIAREAFDNGHFIIACNIARNTNDPELLIMVGTQYLIRGLLEYGLSYFEQAGTLPPLDAVLACGRVCEQLGWKDEALNAYRYVAYEILRAKSETSEDSVLNEQKDAFQI